MDGLVQRTAYAEIPPRVEYTLTERGKSLEKVLTELCIWGRKYMKPLENEKYNLY